MCNVVKSVYLNYLCSSNQHVAFIEIQAMTHEFIVVSDKPKRMIETLSFLCRVEVLSSGA